MAKYNNELYNYSFGWINDHFSKYNTLYRTYGDYYNGKHQNYFKEIAETNENHKDLWKIIQNLKDNMCKVVVDSLASRLELEGFEIDNEETQDWCDRYFAKERISSLAKAIHRDVILYGDAYVTVWTDEKGNPVIKNERPYNMAVKYDIDGNIEYAFKWIIEKIDITKYISHYWFYTKDKIYKRTKEGISIPTQGDIVNSKSEGEDMPNTLNTVPIFHFYNGIRKDAFCRSDLGDVVPLQIALNKEMQSREMASDLTAFKQKYITGVSIPVDENGKPMSTLKAALDNMMMFNNPETRVGEFSATDLNNYTSVINDLRQEISRVSRVPFHVMGLGGDFPSGEALKTAESPLIAKISDKQLLLGDVWEDIFKMIFTIAGQTFETVSAKWTNTQPHSEMEQWQIASLKRELGVSKQQILSEMGYTQDQIDDFRKEEQEEAEQNLNIFNGIKQAQEEQEEDESE